MRILPHLSTPQVSFKLSSLFTRSLWRRSSGLLMVIEPSLFKSDSWTRSLEATIAGEDRNSEDFDARDAVVEKAWTVKKVGGAGLSSNS